MQNALNWLGVEVAEPLSTTAELLVSGGDARIALNAAGRNPYGCPPTPEVGLAGFGSSTASTITPMAFAAAERRRDAIIAELASHSAATVYAREIERIRAELLGRLGLDDMQGLQTVLAPSGTDLHRLIVQLAAAGSQRPLLSIITEAAETGAGVPAAMAACGGQSVEVAARAADGSLRPAAEVDAEVEAAADAAIADGRRVLLVVADVSKTGLISPSLNCVLSLRRRHRHQLDVMIDACQFRISPATLRAYLERGLLVAATGSKFLGGPSFSGALFAPAEIAERLEQHALPPEAGDVSSRGEWPAHWSAGARLGARPNFGLVLRWTAALEHLTAFARLPPGRIATFLDRLGAVVAEEIWRRPGLQAIPSRGLDRATLGLEPGWDQRPSLFAFSLRRRDRAIGPAEAALVQRLLRTNLMADWPGANSFGPASSLRVELGQPVVFGRPGGEAAAALRLSAGAPLIVEALASEVAEQAVLERARCALAKAAWAVEQI